MGYNLLISFRNNNMQCFQSFLIFSTRYSLAPYTIFHVEAVHMFFAPQCVYWGRLLVACYVVLKYTVQAGDGCWSHVTEGWGLYLDDIISSRVDFEGLLSYRHRVGAIVYAARLVPFSPRLRKTFCAEKTRKKRFFRPLKMTPRSSPEK